ncbi:MAG: DUF2815 family protein [Candidatus Thiodiazotropha sp.]|jgi:hypothetical protein
MNDLRENQVIIADAVIGYPHLFQPHKFKNDRADKEADYSCWLILPPNFAFDQLQVAMQDAVNYRWGNQPPADLVPPWRQVPDGPYAGYWYLSAKGFGNQPQVVDQNVQPLLQPDLMLSGSRVNAMVSVFAYDQMGNRGTSCRLHMVQLVETAGAAHLPALQSNIKAEDVFTPVAGAPAPTAAPVAPQAGPAAIPPQPGVQPQAAPVAAPAVPMGYPPGGVAPVAAPQPGVAPVAPQAAPVPAAAPMGAPGQPQIIAPQPAGAPAPSPAPVPPGMNPALQQ